jgi:hypothetical protein
MNRSYSKIRHIQETNMLLEQRRLVNEIYDIGSNVSLTKNGVKVNYTIDAIGNLNGFFSITLKDLKTGKSESYDDNSINKITDTNFKNGLLAIRSKKI